MKYSFQIFTGSLSYQKADYKKIKENLKYVIKLPGKNIGKIIIGWNTDLNLYHDLASYLNNYKLDLYLWFPVFSELGSDVSIEKVLDWQGRKSKSISFNKGENFDFYCPNNPVNIEKIKTTFNKYFDDKMFKGVFLDKIRFPSFSNSKNAVYTCFCTECQNKMEQNGIDVEYLKNVIERQKSISKENIFSINQYSDLEYNFTNKIWQEFFHYKQTSIAEALKKLSCFFRDKGLTVGLDVFAPFLGYFVGQNIKCLLKALII